MKEEIKTELIRTRLNKTLHDQIIEYCRKKNIKISDLIRDAVIKEMNNEFN